MRRSISFGIVLLGVAAATTTLSHVAEAKDRLTLSSLVGRIFKINKSEPAEREVEPRTVVSSAPDSRPLVQSGPQAQALPQAQTRPQALNQLPPLPESQRRALTSAPAPSERLLTGSSDNPASGLPYPPLPPSVDVAWVHPPERRPARAYSTEELRALTRNARSAESSRRGMPRLNSPDSAFAAATRNPVDSPAFAATAFPATQVRQVNHVSEMAVSPVMAVPPVKSLPVELAQMERQTVEPKPVGNTPAEVSQPLLEDLNDSAATSADITTIEPEASGEPLSFETLDFTSRPQAVPSEVTRTLPPVYQKVRGRVAAIDAETGIVRIDLAEEESLPAGTKIRVYHETTGESVPVHLRVLDSAPGVAAANFIDGATTDSIAPGDKMVGWKTIPGE